VLDVAVQVEPHYVGRELFLLSTHSHS